MPYWTSSNGLIALQISRADAAGASHQGRCDDDVDALSRKPSIARQLAKVDSDLLKADLREYGAWDDDDLADHDQNLQRLLWLACGDIREGNF
jgi:hypothetical protein